MSWLLSSFTNQHNVCQRVSQRDLRLISIQFCTHLLAANVIEKLEEAARPSTGIFKVCKLLRCIVSSNSMLYVYLGIYLCSLFSLNPTESLVFIAALNSPATQQPWASCSHTCASVNMQYNLL